MEPKTPRRRQKGMVNSIPHATPRRRTVVQKPVIVPYPAQARPVNMRRPSPTALVITLIVAAFIAVAFLLLSVVAYYVYYQASGRIVPGAQVGGTEIGGMTVTEAAIELQKVWNLESRILVTNGIQSYEIAPAELGLSIDPLQTAQKAHNIGHGGFILEEMVQLYQGLITGWKIVPITSLDSDTARLQLEVLSPQMGKPAKEATIQVIGDQLAAIPGELGYTVNMEETLENLAADPGAVLANGALQVAIKPVIPAVMEATDALAEAQRLLDTPVSIQAYDPISDEYLNWQASRQVVASWIKVIPGGNGPQVGFDAAGIKAYLGALSQELGQERYLESEVSSGLLAAGLPVGSSPLVIVKHRPTTYVVQANDTLLEIGWKLGMPYWMIMEANPGMDPDALWVGAELVVPSKDKMLPLPVIPNKRVVLSISKQHMWVYKDGAAIRDFVISTGIDRSPTQPGVFQVQSHDPNAYASVWDLYMPNFIGIYESWPGFMNGIHGLPTLSNGRRLWANILGSPASYGCIILDLGPAEWLYNWAENGVVVEIKG